MGDKNLPPSHHRLEKARRDGQAPLSRDVTRLVIFGAVFELAAGASSMVFSKLSDFITGAINAISAPLAVKGAATLWMMEQAAMMIAALAGFAALMAVVSTWPQSRFLVSPNALSKGLSRLNPAAGIKGLFGKEKLLMLVIGPAKLAILFCVLVPHLKAALPSIIQTFRISLDDFLPAVGSLIKDVEHRSLPIFLVFAVFDFELQRIMFKRNLMMDHNDMKEEYKEMEGDPHAKGHRKSIQKQLANEVAPKQTRKPNVVAVNPSRIAVALAYQPGVDDLPVIVTKGAGGRADEIRKWARANHVPMIRYVKLARILYATGREGRHIPSSAIEAVAILYQAVRDLEQSGGPAVDDRIELPEIDPRIGDRVLPGISLDS